MLARQLVSSKTVRRYARVMVGLFLKLMELVQLYVEMDFIEETSNVTMEI